MLHKPCSEEAADDLDEEMAGATHRHGGVDTRCDNCQSVTCTLSWGSFITQM